MSFIEMKNIRKDFGKQTILHNVNMSMEKGEVLSIIGPSGAGKSTLLRCLIHLETIQGGSIMVMEITWPGKRTGPRYMPMKTGRKRY